MTRERKPKEAIRAALRVAETRGEVDLIRFRRGMICTFIIYSTGQVAHVRVKRMRHLRRSMEELECEAAEDIAALRLIASGPAISRELWICSPRKNLRFIRITDDGLAELDRDGQPVPARSFAPGRKRVPVCAADDRRIAEEKAAAAAERDPGDEQEETAPADGDPVRLPATTRPDLVPAEEVSDGGGASPGTIGEKGNPASQIGLLLPIGARILRFQKSPFFRVPEKMPNSKKRVENSIFAARKTPGFSFFTPDGQKCPNRPYWTAKVPRIPCYRAGVRAGKGFRKIAPGMDFFPVFLAGCRSGSGTNEPRAFSCLGSDEPRQVEER